MGIVASRFDQVFGKTFGDGSPGDSDIPNPRQFIAKDVHVPKTSHLSVVPFSGFSPRARWRDGRLTAGRRSCEFVPRGLERANAPCPRPYRARFVSPDQSWGLIETQKGPGAMPGPTLDKYHLTGLNLPSPPLETDSRPGDSTSRATQPIHILA